MKKEMLKGALFGLIVSLIICPFTVKAKSASPQGKNTTFYYNGSLQTFTSNYQELGGTYPLYLIRLTNMSADTISTEVSNVNGTYFSFGVRIWSTSIDNVGGFVQDLNGDLHICSMDGMSRSSVESSGTIVDVFFSCNLGSNYKIYSYGTNIGLQNNLQGYAISKLYYYDNRGDIENGEQDPMSQINNDLNGIKNSLNNVNTSINGVTSAIGSASSNIINNQNQNQQQTNEKLDGINDSLTNDDVDTDGAGSFFNGFNDTDHGGISGVVTAPIKFINKLTGTCNSLSIKVFGKDIELPCGDTLFWNKTEVSNFRIIWNMLLGGPILYLLVCKLFKVIENLKNPDDSRVEVMKL